MKFKLFYKQPDKAKAEFIEGKRNGEKVTAENFQNFSRRGGHGERRGGFNRFAPENDIKFDVTQYVSDFKLVGTEKTEKVNTYKVEANIKDKNDQFKSATIWIDQTTFDVVKFAGKLSKGERIESGNVTRIYAPVGSQNVWLLKEVESDSYMVFETPRGEVEIESHSIGKFDNYQLNTGLKDEAFENEK